MWVALIMSVGALGLGAVLGVWGFYATCVGVACAWMYSAEPFRLKRSGWWGPALVGLCYEGLPWFTGALVMSGGLPSPQIISIALCYAIGAHGIMTLNDFKAYEGDRVMGIRSLPVTLGPRAAAQVACGVMLAAQVCVVALLLIWGALLSAALICALIFGQGAAMVRLLRDPERYAPWYNAVGVLMFVSGMMVCAVTLRML